jgi:hypothetical protein
MSDNTVRVTAPGLAVSAAMARGAVLTFVPLRDRAGRGRRGEHDVERTVRSGLEESE